MWEEFWCELVIHGIGGNSIREAQQNLSDREVSIWMRYMKERGSLNIGGRIEQAVGLLSSMYEQVNTKGKIDLKKHYPNLYRAPIVDNDVKQTFEQWGLI